MARMQAYSDNDDNNSSSLSELKNIDYENANQLPQLTVKSLYSDLFTLVDDIEMSMITGEVDYVSSDHDHQDVHSTITEGGISNTSE